MDFTSAALKSTSTAAATGAGRGTNALPRTNGAAGGGRGRHPRVHAHAPAAAPAPLPPAAAAAANPLTGVQHGGGRRQRTRRELPKVPDQQAPRLVRAAPAPPPPPTSHTNGPAAPTTAAVAGRTTNARNALPAAAGPLFARAVSARPGAAVPPSRQGTLRATAGMATASKAPVPPRGPPPPPAQPAAPPSSRGQAMNAMQRFHIPGEDREYEALKAARTRYEAEEAEVKRSLNDAYMQGRCMAKCSRFEYLERVLQNTCDPWELGPDKKPDYNLFVKSFTRSSAGTVQHPDDLRPPEALKLSHEYLLSLIETHSFHATYKFVYDRFRAICRDRTTQHLHLPELATIYEQIIRFYLLAVFLEPEGLVRALELKDLSGVLSDLIYMYSLGVASEHEAEFQCYQVLLYFTDRAKRDALLLKYAESTDPYVRATKQLCLHMAAPIERGPGTPISTYDYARMIKMLKNDLVPLGVALVVTLHLDRLRRDALKDMMLSGFHPSGRAVQTRIDLVTLTRILQFKDVNECREFLAVFAIPVQECEDASDAAIELSRAYAPLLDIAIDIKEPVATKKHPAFLDARVDLGKGFDVVQFIRTGEERTRQVLVAPPQGHGIGTAAAASAAASAAAAPPAGGALAGPSATAPGFAFVLPPSASAAASEPAPFAPTTTSPLAVPNLFEQPAPPAPTAPGAAAVSPFAVPAPFGQPAPPPSTSTVPPPAAPAFSGFSLPPAPTATTVAPTASPFALPITAPAPQAAGFAFAIPPPPPVATSPPRSLFANSTASAPPPATSGFQMPAPTTSAQGSATTVLTPGTSASPFAVPASPATNGFTPCGFPAPAPVLPSALSFALPTVTPSAPAAPQPASAPNDFGGPLLGATAPPSTAPAPAPAPAPLAAAAEPAAAKLADSSTQTDLPPIRIAAPTLDDISDSELLSSDDEEEAPEVFPTMSRAAMRERALAESAAAAAAHPPPTTVPGDAPLTPRKRGTSIPDRSHWSKRAKRSNSDGHTATAPSTAENPAVAAWTRRRIQRLVLRHWARAARTARLDRAPRLSAKDLTTIFSDSDARNAVERGAIYRVGASDLVAAMVKAVTDPAWTELARATMRLQAVQREVYSPWVVLAAANHVVQAFRDLVGLVATAWTALGTHIEPVESAKHSGLPREWTTARVPDLVPTDADNLPPAAARVLCIQHLKSAARGAIEGSDVPGRKGLARAVAALPGYNLTVPFGDALLPWLRAMWEVTVTAHPVVAAAREVREVLVPGKVLVEVGEGVEERATAFLGWLYSSMEVVRGKVREDPVVGE